MLWLSGIWGPPPTVSSCRMPYDINKSFSASCILGRNICLILYSLYVGSSRKKNKKPCFWFAASVIVTTSLCDINYCDKAFFVCHSSKCIQLCCSELMTISLVIFPRKWCNLETILFCSMCSHLHHFWHVITTKIKHFPLSSIETLRHMLIHCKPGQEIIYFLLF